MVRQQAMDSTINTSTAQSPSLYGSAWQRARAAYLRKHPLCKHHEARGLVVAATVVDHIVPHRRDMALFWDSGNWQPLCAPCHDSWKQRQERGGVDTGCSFGGIPTDPRHPWAQAMQARGGM